MPNHCWNELEISGDDQRATEAVFEFMCGTDTEFDFNNLIPYPAQYAERDRDYQAIDSPVQKAAFETKYGGRQDGFNTGGYNWCRANWGTKWNAYRIQRVGNRLLFETAWSPPEPVIIALAKRFPECSFHLEFFECGMEYAGGFSCLCRADWYDDALPFEAGRKWREWQTDSYHGNKGG